MVHADAQRGVVLAADVEEADKAFFQPCQFGGVFLVGIFQLLELAGGVDVVARVDAHLLHDGGGHVGHVGVEVDIGHERAVVAFAAQGFAQGLQCLGLACALCGESHVVRSRVEYGAALAERGFDISGHRGRHALDAQRFVAAEGAVAHADLVGAAWTVVEQVHVSWS